MRYLLFAPLIPIALVIYFSVRRFIPDADPEEIYVMLFVSVIGAIVPFVGIGLVCRFLESRGIIAMPSWTMLYAFGWAITATYIVVHLYLDRREAIKNHKKD